MQLKVEANINLKKTFGAYMIEFLHYLLNLLKILLGIGLQAKEITYGNWLL